VGGAGGLKEGGAGGGLPGGGRDFDELQLGVGEVEEDLVGEAVRAAVSHAAKDGGALVGLVEVGLGFEVVEDGVEFAGGGQGVELGVASVKEPVAEAGGADGHRAAASVIVETDEGLAVGSGEGFAAAGEVDHLGEWFGLHRFLS